MIKRVFLAGGSGFVGTNFVDRFTSMPEVERITVFDNFSSGTKSHLSHQKDHRVSVIEGDIRDLQALSGAMAGHDTVIHLASNPDIARAMREPTVDFDQGTILTQNVLEAMRTGGVQRILYASGSGIYGDTGNFEVSENHGPLEPISTYGASKLAGEALICSYSFMFGLSGIAFRFGNIVGPQQTHGVGYDFIRKLQSDPSKLEILGDGTQSKSYIYITDVINAVLTANEKSTKPFNAFNVATGDYITVREIAKIAVEEVLGKNSATNQAYGESSRGWAGDVPVLRLNTDKIRTLGWLPEHNSAQAIRRSIQDMLAGVKAQTAPVSHAEQTTGA